MMSSPLHSVTVSPASLTLTEALDQASSLIRSHHRFLISGHAHPDGDVVGSTLALAHLLRALGKEVILFNVDPLPYNMHFLPGADAYVHVLPPDAQPEVTCLLDCHLRSRAGDRFPLHGWAPRTLIIDHHRFQASPPAADALVHDPSASSTGELVYRLHKALGVPMSQALAECLYTSIISDTGGFRYSNTSPVALNIAADLIAHGVNPWHITSHVYENNPLARLQLLACVLQTLELSPCGRLAFLSISLETLEAFPQSDSLLDGFINHARSIQGVEVAAQLRQTSQNTYQISFRSRGHVDVSTLAARFGGGGHRNAAGCLMQGALPDIRAQLSQALGGLLDHSSSQP